MPVSAEKLASNLDWSVIWKSSELRGRLLFTLFMLAVFRLGTYIPVPGIDLDAIDQFFKGQANNAFGMFNVLLGGGLSRMSIVGLGIMPYISASIIMQILTVVVPSLAALKKEGSVGQQKINQYTRYFTLGLALIQGYLLVYGLESFTTTGFAAVLRPGWFFRIAGMVSITGGTMFLMWTGEQITQRGIGNGISFIVFSGIVANLPRALVATLSLGRTGALSATFVAGFLVFAFVVLAFIVLMETAQRRVTVRYPRQQRSGNVYEGGATHLPIKINPSGVIPPIFATSILIIPATIFRFGAGYNHAPYWLQVIVSNLAVGRPIYMAVYGLLIVFFTFFYTSIIFDPKETAENLKQGGAIVPGYRPGQQTAEHIDYILTRLGIIAALYLVAVCLIPQVLLVKYSVPFYFGGTSLLIVVSVSLSVFAQLQGYLYAHQYRHLMERSVSPTRAAKGRRGSRRVRR